MVDDEETTTLRVPGPGGRRRDDVTLPTGRVDDRYRVREEIGRGGMSVVYRAIDEHDGTVCALKVAQLSSFDDGLLERMAAEATMLLFLRHPNLVAVHDMGTDEAHQLHYAVMDYAPGGSLGALCAKLKRLPVDQVAAAGVQLCCVLSMLHGRGIVHRDVKPTNLLLDAQGRVLLTDLGISELPDAMGESTRDDLVMGSFPFMAPEQRMGLDRVTPSSDLYAVGTTLYNLATGATSRDLFAVRDENPRWLDLPKCLRGVLRHATQLLPENRPANALVLGRALAPLAPPELFDEQPHLASWLDGEEDAQPDGVGTRGP